MNKNSYVTAALFVVFVLLTVFYVSIGDGTENDAKVGSTSAVPQANLEMKETDAQSAEELTAKEDGKEVKETKEAKGTKEEKKDEKTSSIQIQRSEVKKAESELVAQLKSIIASKDSDATEKSEAKDDLDKITKDTQHQTVLESLIKAKGYDDVLVRTNEETVQVFLEGTEEPTLEQTNEIIMMAKTEFATNPDVHVEFKSIK
ncbi:SpoIIIAH-like family protein [Turicibacter sp. 1E2]|uniref:SpoIIIAH-like family protein n=1 Tax=Turicibacter sp. 1E2 TaxID=2951143 RepID=UPI0019AE4ED5|nr:SpoIIIAH-like family protein [Turicibacter sp. 1E2]MBC9721217.1 SpoIIIAH-like family protein [Lactobacillus sp.]MCU7209427.1 SpoIIIAH-like family protein [Turicibacter sp. 1E2]